MTDQPPVCQIITPVGCMGYGFDEDLIYNELTKLVPNGIPTAIILDAGSTDSGPQKLAIGSMTCPRSAYVKDLTALLRLAHTFRVPLIFSSAGGDGSDEHVKVMSDIIEEISAEENNKDYSFKTVSIFSGIEKATIIKRLRDGRVTGCGTCVPTLTESDVESSPRVVAQAGPEPFIDAMEAHPDFNIIIGGRAYDPAPYAAFAMYQLTRTNKNLTAKDSDAAMGGFVHMGKIMECGGQCSKPKSHSAVVTVYANGVFDVRPGSPESRCTPQSVAAHTLYEKTRPDILHGPGGALHLHDARYEQLADEHTVRVSGSQHHSWRANRLPYQIKLEAAHVVGYRSIFMGRLTDHILISQIDKILALIKAYVREQHPDTAGEWELDFQVYGKGQRTDTGPGELFVIAEALAQTQKLANSIASKARVGMIHASYPGQKATAGNFGFGIGGLMEIEMGQCAEFSLYHLMDLEPGEEHLSLSEGKPQTKPTMFRGSVQTIGKGKPASPVDEAFRRGIASLKQRVLHSSNGVVKGATAQQLKTQGPKSSPKNLSDLCDVMRSKNSGPYEITLDAVFGSEEIYQSVKNSNLLSRANVAKALGILEEDIIWMGFYDPAIAFKVTVPRIRGGKRTAAGGFMENDVHGSQEHMGLATLPLPQTNSLIPSGIFETPEWSTLVAVVVTVGSIGVATAARRLLKRS